MTRTLLSVPHNRVLKYLLVCLLALPILAIGHELITVAAAALLRWLLHAEFFVTLIGVLPIDKAEATIIAKSLGGVEAIGVAVAGLPGQVLHDLIPGLFTEPASVVPGAMVSAVITKESTVTGWLGTIALTETALIIAGGLFIRSGWRRWRVRNSSSRWRGALWIGLGLLSQAEALISVVRLHLSRPMLENMGVGLFLGPRLKMNRMQYEWLLEQALPYVIPAMILAVGFLSTWGLSKLLGRLEARRLNPKGVEGVWADVTSLPVQLRLTGMLIIFVGFFQFFPDYGGIGQTNNDVPAAVSLLQVASYIPADDPPFDTKGDGLEHVPGAISPGSTSVPATRSRTVTLTPTLRRSTPLPRRDIEKKSTPLRATATHLPTSTPMPTPNATPSRTPKGPSMVEIRKASSGLALYVNGRPRMIRAINYNVNYTQKPEPEQLALHRRDFQILRQHGFNAITGLGSFNENTLKAADEYGLGVVFPYRLDLDGDYANVAYREQVKRGFLGFVARYKDFPALWGWNPGGDEWLHNRQQVVKDQDARQAGADFLIELADAAHQADPNHLVFTKEPRDWYLPLLEQAINKVRSRGQEPNTYFVYGGNFYGNPEEMGSAMVSLKASVDQRLGVALCITEYGPYGLDREGRSSYYVQIWRKLIPLSIGGSAFVYTGPNNPNPSDRAAILETEFRMVNYDGVMVDDTLDALGAEFKAELDMRRGTPTPKP